MKYLLITLLAVCALTGWSYFWAKGEQDNFGAVFVPLVGAAISTGLTIAYVVAALWLHRGW